ncbi:MAG: NTP transferase domain-containing protein [Methanobacterium sp.]|nr:NTP transferase domain-containing protein [Methanobacterium sp.]
MNNLKVSAVITAAGKNRRMVEDLKSRNLEIKHKLLMDIGGKPVILHTIANVLKSGVDECIVVLGHFSEEIYPVLEDYPDERLKIVKNPENNVELSETLLNGVQNSISGLILCAAGDQPTVTTETYKNLAENALNYPHPENIVSVLARNDTGLLKTAKGLGMPFVCHSDLLLKYLPHQKDNLNPLLIKMIEDGVVFWGIPALNNLELVNINTYQDYINIKYQL